MMVKGIRIIHPSSLALLLIIAVCFPTVQGLIQTDRRTVIFSGPVSTLLLPSLQNANALPLSPTTTTTAATGSVSIDTSPLIKLTAAPKPRPIFIPRIGYSMYKTTPDQVIDGVKLALQAGVRHFDVATLYGTNEQVGLALKDYILNGLPQDTPKTSRKQRERELFVTHKISNTEQSLDRQSLKKAVLAQASVLGVDQLDLVMLHSPLPGRDQRLQSYATLCDLQERGKIGAVGVCHFGIKPLQQLVDAGLPPPTVIQLELSPFNQHRDVADWAKKHKSTLMCAAWSKLSSVEGPQEGWAKLADLAKNKGMTKQQVLIRWAVQKGYLCAPRSSSKYKVDRQAIMENSWDSTKSFILSDDEMAFLDGLDEQLPAGRLGLYDGWDTVDIVDATWDPTFIA